MALDNDVQRCQHKFNVGNNSMITVDNLYDNLIITIINSINAIAVTATALMPSTMGVDNFFRHRRHKFNINNNSMIAINNDW